MKNKEKIIEMIMTFFIVTACITILEGIFGGIFMPEAKLDYSAFFSPPLFGFFSSILSLVTYSSKELTIRQMLIRQAIHLLLIELLVFGINAAAGNLFDIKICVALALTVAVIYVMVCVVLWVNDQKSASEFNQRLQQYQMQHATSKNK